MNSFTEYQREIDQLLAKRLAAYPTRDASYYQLQATIERLADYLFDTCGECNFTDGQVCEVKDLLDSPVFIGGNMKTGTTLMLQLLDGPDEILALPGDTHLVRNYLEKKYEAQELTRIWLKRLINPTGNEPFWFLGRNEWIWRRFVEVLRFCCAEDSWRHDIERVVSAIHIASGRDGVHKWIEKTPRNEAHVEQLLGIYPNAKFIFMVRCPLENVASIKKLADVRDREFSAGGSARAAAKSIQNALNNAHRFPGRCMIVRYENLVRMPRFQIKEVCKFLDFKWDDQFSIPSRAGHAAQSNSMYATERRGRQVSDRSERKRWMNVLTQKEKEAVVTQAWDSALQAGYTEWRGPQIRKYRAKDNISFFRKVFRKVRR